MAHCATAHGDPVSTRPQCDWPSPQDGYRRKRPGFYRRDPAEITWPMSSIKVLWNAEQMSPNLSSWTPLQRWQWSRWLSRPSNWTRSRTRKRKRRSRHRTDEKSPRRNNPAETDPTAPAPSLIRQPPGDGDRLATSSRLCKLFTAQVEPTLITHPAESPEITTL